MAQEEKDRPFFKALLFERDGDLNLTWLFTLLMGLVGSAGFVYTLITPGMSLPDRLAAWSFLAGAFASVLIAALPIAKAKILANAKLPSELSKNISSIRDVTESTDIQELSQKYKPTEEEKG
jgi:hypothetical protein